MRVLTIPTTLFALLIGLASCRSGAPPSTAAGTVPVPGASPGPAASPNTALEEIKMPETVSASKDGAPVCFIQPTEELRKKLSPEQYDVLVQAATEPPFQNLYWNNHAEGVYVDAIDGTPLFLSTTKFESGTGWPSFWQPIDPGALVLVEDRSFGMIRTEVRAKKSGGHLGHLFDDGPTPTGLRYCINSASLDFVPKSELAARGLGSLLTQF